MTHATTKFKDFLTFPTKQISAPLTDTTETINQVRLAFDECSVLNGDRVAILSLLDRLNKKSGGREHYWHSLRVGVYANLFGRLNNLPKAYQRALLYAGLLHDIGKIFVSPKLLKKVNKGGWNR